MLKFLVSGLTVFFLADGIAMIVSNSDWRQIAIAAGMIGAGAVLLEARFKLHDKG